MSDKKVLSVGFRTPFTGISKEKSIRPYSQTTSKNSTGFSGQEEKKTLDALGDKPSKSLLGAVKDRLSLRPPQPQQVEKKSNGRLDQTKSGGGQGSTVSKEEILKADATIEKFSRTSLPKNLLYQEDREEPLFASDSPLGKILMQSHEHVQTSMIRPDSATLNSEFWPASLDSVRKK